MHSLLMVVSWWVLSSFIGAAIFSAYAARVGKVED